MHKQRSMLDSISESDRCVSTVTEPKHSRYVGFTLSELGTVRAVLLVQRSVLLIAGGAVQMAL